MLDVCKIFNDWGSIFVHEKKKKNVILYFPYWFLHFKRMQHNTCSMVFHYFQSFLELHAKSRGLWFVSHFIGLTRGSLCDLPLRRTLPLSLTAVAQNSHMLVSKATKQDLCPGRVDRHESVAALTKKSIHFYSTVIKLVICMCDIKS